MAGRVFDLLHALIAKCELSIKRDAPRGVWQVSAKGPLALLALVAIIIFWHYAK